jgi:hypothetical protein
MLVDQVLKISRVGVRVAGLRCAAPYFSPRVFVCVGALDGWMCGFAKVDNGLGIFVTLYKGEYV